jgi:TP901 family phage tail tape measure protein
MADVDPRIVEFEREAAKTLAAMKRSQARAAEFEAATEKGTTSARELESRVRQEVAKDRIKGETIGEKPAPVVEEQAKATRKASSEQENLNRVQTQAARSEANLNRLRTEGTRTMETQLAALRRYGTAAGSRYLAKQGGNSALQQVYLEQAAQGRGPLVNPVTGAGSQKLLPAGEVIPPKVYPQSPIEAGAKQGPFAIGDEQVAKANAATKANASVNESLKQQQAILTKGKQDLANYTRENQRLIQVQASGSNVLRKHGALTSEFIQAAQRGEVTIRELGYQTSATIGKFGGWLVAGGAVYAALGAVTAMGRGALDAYSGVNLLNRVINNVDASHARQEFRSLSDEFNLPISEVSEAAYQMGKVFHNTDDALSASRSILYSVSVGELDVATATRYLTAITNGFQLTAKDTPGIFDQINQAQNKFGISIADVEAGVAKAAGTFKSAGGDFNHLLAIITTAQKATGVTGEVAGTAIARAPNFLRQASNQAALREFGINANAPIDDIIDQAFKKARHLQGDRIQELAAAIFGPQYGARIGTPLLQQFDLYNKVLDKTSPKNSEGSAAKELATQLASAKEQLKNVGTQLEILGANLAEAGLVDIFASIVLSLDDALRLVNQMVEAFNALPDGLKTTLAYMLQISLIMRGLQRFNIGGQIAPPGGESGRARSFLGASLGGGDARDARLIRKGLYDEQAHLEEQRSRLSSESVAASERAVTARTRANAAQAEVIRLEKAGATDTKAYADATQRSAIYAAEADRAVERRTIAALDEEETSRRLNQTNANIARTRGRFGGLNVPETIAVAKEGGFYPTSFGTPTTKPPQEYTRGAGGGLPSSVTRGAVILGEKPTQQMEEQAKAAEAEAVKEKTRSSRFNTAASKAGAAVNRLVGSFGTIFFGVAIVSVIAEALKGQADSLSEQIDKVSVSTATNAKQAAEQLHASAQELQSGNGVADYISEYVTGGALDPLGFLSDLATGQDTKSKQLRDAIATQTQANARLQAEQQNEALRANEPVPFRYAKDIQKDVTELKSSNKSRRQIDAGLKDYDEELQHSLEALGQAGGTAKEQAARLKGAEASLKAARASNAGNKDLAQRLLGLQQDQVTAELDASVTLLGQPGGFSGQSARRAGTLYADLIRRLGTSKNPEDIKALDQARSNYYDALQSSIQDELDAALQLADSPQERSAAYATALSRLRQQFITRPGNAADRQQQEVDDLRRKVVQERQGRDITVQTRGGPLDLTVTDNKRLKRLQESLRNESADLKALTADQKQRKVIYQQMREELKQQQYEEEAALRASRTSLRVAQTADPLEQARINIAALGKEINLAINVYGRNSKEVLDLMAQQQQAIAQQAEAQLARIEAQGALTAAGLSGKGDEIPQAKAELANMQQRLAYMQSHRDLFDPAEIINLQAEIVGARIDLAQQIEDQAEELRLAVYDIAIARADASGNAVLSAKESVRRARYELRSADTPQERKEARATLIGAKAGVQQAIFDRETEDIQYQADIGKLTLQQQIRAYQGLLHTLDLTRNMRRDLKKKIYDLKQSVEGEDGGFDLALGNIKLPTIYEVKRALGGGVNQQSTVQVNNNPTINVNGAQDPNATARAVNQQIGGSNKAALRSAGLV